MNMRMRNINMRNGFGDDDGAGGELQPLGQLNGLDQGQILEVLEELEHDNSMGPIERGNRNGNSSQEMESSTFFAARTEA